MVIPDAPGDLDASIPPQEQHPHVDPLPSSPVMSSSLSSSSPSESSEASNQVDKKKNKRKIKKKKNKKGTKLPNTVGHVGNQQPTTLDHARIFDDVVMTTKTTREPKIPLQDLQG
jgi:hypothetical protein